MTERIQQGQFMARVIIGQIRERATSFRRPVRVSVNNNLSVRKPVGMRKKHTVEHDQRLDGEEKSSQRPTYDS
ncbi:hypothetical protein [Larkinella humicola]|uniref:Uncharacterized protein n=1 Tax=Larkinella humicola TaxID=2607654 RepID=A0A5N1J3J1_9BACT|nr:hypothetical protein [Larkinella humicola]KAA9341102.1 hypothetical protein F0P93_30130 [Larkinella humicola]